MKPVKYIGVALVAAAALGTVACNNGSTSAPDFNSVYSSAVVTQNPQSSSSEIALNLSSGEQNIMQSSSSVNALSSSGKIETCKHVTDVLCEPCPPGEKCSCHPCDVSKEGVCNSSDNCNNRTNNNDCWSLIQNTKQYTNTHWY